MTLESFGWLGVGLAIGAVAVWAGMRRRQTALAESEARLRDYAEANADWFWERDAELRFVRLSPGFSAAGFVEADYIGQTRLDVCPDGTDPVVWARHLADVKERRAFAIF